MTSGTIDQIKIGHVLRYVYLFRSEADAGRDEGVKERPVVVVDVDYDKRRVQVLPVTTKGEGWLGAIPLPAQVASACGLSPQSSIVVTEYNDFQWLGYDIRPVGNTYIAGRLPPGFTDKILTLAARAEGINRD
jgi:hypothetical protein